MIVLFGFGHKTNSVIGPLDKTTCQTCDKFDFPLLIKTRTWFTMFFIPVFPYKTVHFIKCSICEALKPISNEKFEDLKALSKLNQAAVDGSISEEDFQKRREEYYAR